MAKHPLLDHILVPEREILKHKEQLVREIAGSNRTVRSGEQYISSHACGALIVTSNPIEVHDFETRHLRCRG